jgi:D-arabinose 1-dehydrogenase-like Zn-dependent alcohol dehydrogenase
MKAAVVRGPGRVAAEDWPRPEVGAGEVRLRLRGCGLCGSDVAKIADPPGPGPLVVGHEVARLAEGVGLMQGRQALTVYVTP